MKKKSKKILEGDVKKQFKTEQKNANKKIKNINEKWKIKNKNKKGEKENEQN